MTSTERARHVVVALGGPIVRFVLGEDFISEADIVGRYGERFRGAKLVRFSTLNWYDDEPHVNLPERWAVVAADVTNPSRTITDCYLQEFREGNFEKKNALWFSGPTVSDYAGCCDDGLLFMRGIVFVDQVDSSPDIQQVLSDDEVDELWGRPDHDNSCG